MLGVAVEVAHSAGLAAAVHVQSDERAKNVILGGAHSIEHRFLNKVSLVYDPGHNPGSGKLA
jgi:hypothetical protein